MANRLLFLIQYLHELELFSYFRSPLLEGTKQQLSDSETTATRLGRGSKLPGILN
jgi:hypothetical protein